MAEEKAPEPQRLPPVKVVTWQDAEPDWTPITHIKEDSESDIVPAAIAAAGFLLLAYMISN